MRFIKRLRALVFRKQLEDEIAEELRFHLDGLINEGLEAGAEWSQAERRARKRLGNPLVIKEDTRDVFVFRHLEAVWRDGRHSIRSLRRTPALLAVAVLSLGLGIGATVTLYRILDALLLHDVTARDPDRLVAFSSVSYPTYRDVRDSGVFDDTAAGNQCSPMGWREGDRVQAVFVNCLSGNFFDVVGGGAAIGRVFTAAEAAPENNPRVAVVSHHFARRLGGGAEVIGRELALNDTSFTIIGILPSDYRAIQGYGIAPDVFVPFNTALQPQLMDRNAPAAQRMRPIGRLRSNRSREQTQLRLNEVLNTLQRQLPAQADQRRDPVVLTPVAGLGKYGESDFDRNILRLASAMTAVVLMVLLIACANVAGVLLVKGVSRNRDISLRIALGASRSQLIRQLLIEAAVVAGAGTAVGLALTSWVATFLSMIAIPVQDGSLRLVFSPNWRIAVAAAGIMIAVTLISGLAPAIATSRAHVSQDLNASRGTTARLSLRSVIVTAQVAVSVALLSVAFLCVRSLVVVLNGNAGFDTSHTAWFDIALRLPQAEQVGTRDRIFRALESHPGVEAVSWAWFLPFQVSYGQPIVRSVEHGEREARVIEQGIGPGYLNVMRIPLFQGREFTWEDLRLRAKGALTPVIVNAALARVLFPGGHAVGKQVVRLGPRGPSPPLTIVGVSSDTDFRSPGEEPPSLLQSLAPISPSFVVRTAGSASTVIPEITRVIDRTVPGSANGAWPVTQRLNNATFPIRAGAVVLGMLAAVGLTLALIGVSGIAVYNVTRRTREIGIRVALGATKHQIIRLMMKDGLQLVGVGAGTGLALVLVSARVLESFLAQEISPRDPMALGAAIVTLAATAGVSVWIPSRRAARIDPCLTLRAD